MMFYYGCILDVYPATLLAQKFRAGSVSQSSRKAELDNRTSGARVFARWKEIEFPQLGASLPPDVTTLQPIQMLNFKRSKVERS